MIILNIIFGFWSVFSVASDQSTVERESTDHSDTTTQPYPADIQVLNNIVNKQQLQNKLELDNQHLQNELVHDDQLLKTKIKKLEKKGQSSCAELHHNGYKEDGVYTVYINGNINRPKSVYCDMTTNGGGWTVLQRRYDGSVDFYRNWQDYKSGFGDIGGEHWLGNEVVAEMTSQGSHVLRVDLEGFEGNPPTGDVGWAEYTDFSISDESDGFRLSVNQYTGNMGDALTIGEKNQNRQKFTTFDKDNDQMSSLNCAEYYHGAFWFNACCDAHLNGRFYQFENTRVPFHEGIMWVLWKGDFYSARKSTMKFRVKLEKKRQSSCADLYHNGIREDGVYTVYINGNFNKPKSVYCDMTTNGGGWTVFQRRYDGSVDFYRNWQEYKSGFGDIGGEHWLGNEVVAEMTSHGSHVLRVDLEGFEGDVGWAEYTDFSISDESDGFRLSVNQYTGNMGDAIKRGEKNQNGQQFTTYDKDNDQESSGNCAEFFHGAFWFGGCFDVHLNGRYYQKSRVPDHEGICWDLWKGNEYSARKSAMKFRPANFKIGHF